MELRSVLFLLPILFLGCDAVVKGETYRAAVYEHKIVFPWPWAHDRQTAVAQMMVNLDAYEHHAAVAGKQGVDIMVFGEDGLYGWHMKHRWAIKPYLEPIPDPAFVKWNPCLEPMRFPMDDVQVRLSCIAKRNNMYVVANMGDIQPCKKGDPQCPKDGVYQYNTNVAYDRKGNFIAKYHKQHRYLEPQFNAPVFPEHIFIDTEFGRFGLVICNDILFYDPIVELIREYNVTDLVFPMAFPDVLPLYIGISYVNSFAVGHSVNIIAANVRDPHNPGTYVYGSGMFTPKGPVKYLRDTFSKNGLLLIADVPINIRAQKKLPCDVNPLMFGHPNMKALAKPDFMASVHMDWFNFVFVKGTEGTVTVCQAGFCCSLTYKKQMTYEMYAFGAFNGLHKAYGPIYQQVCLLTKCKNKSPLSCGQPVLTANTQFASFNMKGSFSSPFIQPQILLSGPGYQLDLPLPGTFHYDTTGLSGSALKKPLIQASLLGRVYRKDCLTCLGG